MHIVFQARRKPQRGGAAIKLTGLIIHEAWFYALLALACSREDGKLIAEDDAGQTRC